MTDDLKLNLEPPASRTVSRRQLLLGTGGSAVPAAISRPPSKPAGNNTFTPPIPAVQHTQHERSRGRQSKRPAEDSVYQEEGAHEGNNKRSRPTTGPSENHARPEKAGDGMASSLFSRVAIPRLQSKPKAAAPLGPSNAPTTGPVTFESLGLHPLLVQHLKGPKMNIGDRPTDIQKRALSYLLPQGRYTMEGEEEEDQPSKFKRDVLMASQTGSGKSLAFLLPILDSLLPLSTLSFIDRSVGGCLAIILTPTRELARQIYEVLEKLVSLPLRLQGPSGEALNEGPRMSRWIVPTLLCGGSTKNHEKQRLRKGSTIVVATPGRLLDHLQNTAAFEVGKLRWLVLDEADRLMELGFKEALEGIFRALEGRRKLALAAAKTQAVEQEKALSDGSTKPIPGEEDHLEHMGVRWWAGGRRTVLCSATIDEDIQALAGQALTNPIVVRGHGGKDEEAIKPVASTSTGGSVPPHQPNGAEQRQFTAPAQLLQNYVLVPPKLRLVTLIALLRQSIYNQPTANASSSGPQRIIVFMSCTDAVDFHWLGIGGFKMGAVGTEESNEEAEIKMQRKIYQTNELLPGTTFYRLHGSMSQNERIASLKSFARNTPSATREEEQGSHQASVLFCTSVASRGLDLPSVSTVLQLDAPTEGGVEEYVHRIGRTARVGRQGKSWIMLFPHEARIVQKYQAGMIIDTPKRSHPSIEPVDFRDVLKEGFGGMADEYEARATDVQLAWERWVLHSERVRCVPCIFFVSRDSCVPLGASRVI